MFSLRKLTRPVIDWISSFADKPHANVSLFIFCFLESSVSPLPSDTLYFPMLFAQPKRAFRFAAWCTAGTVLGAIIGYIIGSWLLQSLGYSIIEFYNAYDEWEAISEAYRGEFGFWFVALAAITPVPYKISTIAAGATRMDVFWFIVVSIVARGIRYFSLAVLAYYYGPVVKKYLKKYNTIVFVILVAVIVLGYVAVKFVF